MIDTEKIKAKREHLKLTMEQAARAAGMSGRQHWYKVESGQSKNVTVETLERIAAALGLKAKDLLK